MLPFTLGPVTITKDSESTKQPRPGCVAVIARCSVCGASSKAEIGPYDDGHLRHFANAVMRHLCPERGHGRYS